MADKKRIRKKLNVTLAEATHAILSTKGNKGVAIDEAVINYFTPTATDGVFHEKVK